jgi:hypothetical protein
LGASYDIFGDGRTAIKASIGRYLGVNAVDVANANNPLITSVNSVTRTWADTNADYVPDCNLASPLANGECGPYSNENFGKLNANATVWGDDVIRGFGARDYLWDVSTEVQHQLTQGLSVTAGYYRNWAGNFRVTDNLAVGPENYDPYCITAPTDARLPGGGGYPVCGLFDLNPSKFGQVQNLVTQAETFGKQTRVSDFVGVSVSSRFASGVRLGGGVDTGRTVTDNCFVVDSPQQLQFCRQTIPFAAQSQVKLFGSYPLPRDFVVSGVFQNIGGPNIIANYSVPNSVVAPSLGRNLSACGTRPACTATATVALIEPGQLWEERKTQVDVRLTKLFRFGPRAQLQANLDVYNLLNTNAIQGINGVYGAQWLQPSGSASTSPGAIVDGRLLELSGTLRF